jgi:hypothetical protein
MNCKRCHHVNEAHIPSNNKTLMKVGKCQIPDCRCMQYLDPIREIDEELI